MSLETNHQTVDIEQHEGLLETLGANVMPILATGVSLMWLISSVRGAPPIPGKVRRAASRLGDRATAVIAPVGEKAGDLLGQVRDRAQGLGSQARGLGSQARGQASHLGGTLSHTAEGATNELSRLIEEKPLVVCGAAALLGAALGFLVPETQKEHALMGPVKENMVEKARAIVEDMKEQAKGQVEQVRDRATQALEDLAPPAPEQASEPEPSDVPDGVELPEVAMPDPRNEALMNEDLEMDTRDRDVGLTDAYFGPDPTESPARIEEGSEFDHSEDLLADTPPLASDEEERNL